MPRAAIPIVVLVAVIALVVALLSGDGPEPTKTTNGTDPGSESTGEFDSASEAARSFETDETKTAETTEVVIPPPVDLEAADRDLDLFGRVIDPRGQPIPGAKIGEFNRFLESIFQLELTDDEGDVERTSAQDMKQAAAGACRVRTVINT